MSVQFTSIDFGKLTLYNFDGEGKTKKSVHDIDIGGASYYNLSNVVNGLACAYSDKAANYFYLINLITFETTKHSKRRIKGSNYIDAIILGFNPSTGLEKFVRIYSRYGIPGSHYFDILENSVSFEPDWKIIAGVPFLDNIDTAVYLDGAIHWMMKPRSSDKRKQSAFDIMKLDMKKERFEMVVSIPGNEYDGSRCQIRNFSLSEDKGKLYVLHFCPERKCLEGWRLKESKRDCVWNVVFHVDFASMIDEEGSGLIGNDEHPCLFDTGIVDGKVLIRRRRLEEGVYIYDLVHKKLTEHGDIRSFSLKYMQRNF